MFQTKKVCPAALLGFTFNGFLLVLGISRRNISDMFFNEDDLAVNGFFGTGAFDGTETDYEEDPKHTKKNTETTT